MTSLVGNMKKEKYLYDRMHEAVNSKTLSGLSFCFLTWQQPEAYVVFGEIITQGRIN